MPYHLTYLTYLPLILHNPDKLDIWRNFDIEIMRNKHKGCRCARLLSFVTCYQNTDNNPHISFGISIPVDFCCCYCVLFAKTSTIDPIDLDPLHSYHPPPSPACCCCCLYIVISLPLDYCHPFLSSSSLSSCSPSSVFHHFLSFLPLLVLLHVFLYQNE